MRLRQITLPALLILATTAAFTSAAPQPHELHGGALFPASLQGATGATSLTAATGPSGTTAATTTTPATVDPSPTGPTPLSAALTQTVPGASAEILTDGYAAAPAAAPPAVQQAIWAANQLIGLPYLYGGGHASFDAAGYDCSGAVSYALRGGGLLDAPLDSTQLETWGLAGDGAWITVYANAAHAFLEVAGIRLDTSAAGDPGGLPGPRWRPLLAATAGYVARSAEGY